jgi:hypothetical protein
VTVVARLFALGIGLPILGIGLHALRDVWRMRRWPWVIGTVVDMRLILVEGGHEAVDSHVLYRYQVDGATYRNDRQRPGLVNIPSSILIRPQRDNRLQWEKARDPVEGARVRVYYNPRNPSDSTLMTRADWAFWVVLGLGVAAVALGVLGGRL